MLTRDDPILIVDDDNLVRLGLQMTLENQGYRNLYIAKAGMAAIDMAVRYRPKVILLDVRLKGDLDGVEAAQSIRQKYPPNLSF
jgi:DNA-binding NarL/FixJ family response regulator